MRRKIYLTLFIAAAALVVASCGNRASKEQKAEADQLMDSAYRQKSYDRLLQLADSLEPLGCLSAAKADYWRGYAFDRQKDSEKAEACWRRSMESALASSDEADKEMYVKSASHLVNMLSMKRDFQGVLAVAEPAVKLLEEQKRDTTSDYVNLLIYIGIGQVGSGQSAEDADNAFFRANRKHRENIARHPTDEAYKDAIAGLVNIAYSCVRNQKYKAALYYTGSFGELLGEYEQRPDVDAFYVDRQVGRYTIYKAKAQLMLGQKDEAAKTYEAFLATKFSQSSEGQRLAEDYLSENKDYAGVYVDDDGTDNNLVITSDGKGGYRVTIGIFRLASFDDGVALPSGSGLAFTATDPSGQPIAGTITLDGNVATVTFTDSHWDYLPNGEQFRYTRR